MYDRSIVPHPRWRIGIALSLLAALMLARPAKAHFCGDGEKNQTIEECDPPDDAGCPGLCTYVCTCAVCGNGVLDDPVEECDGANAAACPGACRTDCTCPVCGDGMRQGAEQCDGTDDDACPAACLGNCACPRLCGAQPLAASQCDVAARARLSIRDDADDAKDGVTWKSASSTVVSPEALGDPTFTTDFSLCIYDSGSSSPRLAAVLVAPYGARWTAGPGAGATYADPNATSTGLRTLRIRSKATGSSVRLQARGTSVPLPAAFDASRFFEQATNVTVQLVGRDGFCMGAAFAVEDTVKNTPLGFSAKRP